MSFKKRVSKSIALALVGVMIATPMLNTVSAIEMENTTVTYEMNQLKPLSNDEVDSAIRDFQNQHGNEDKFKLISNEDGEVIEVNGYRGILRLSNYDKNGNVTENVTNVTKNLTNLENQVLELIKQGINTTKDLVVKTGKTKMSISRTTASLQQKHLILRVGSNRIGHWEVKD